VEAARALVSTLDLRDPSGRTRRDVISATNSLEYGRPNQAIGGVRLRDGGSSISVRVAASSASTLPPA